MSHSSYAVVPEIGGRLIIGLRPADLSLLRGLAVSHLVNLTADDHGEGWREHGLMDCLHLPPAPQESAWWLKAMGWIIDRLGAIPGSTFYLYDDGGLTLAPMVVAAVLKERYGHTEKRIRIELEACRPQIEWWLEMDWRYLPNALAAADEFRTKGSQR